MFSQQMDLLQSGPRCRDGPQDSRAKWSLDVGRIGIKLSAGGACWPAIVGEGPLRCKGLSCEVPRWSAVKEGPRPEAIRREE